jgi:hypothetical protein
MHALPPADLGQLSALCCPVSVTGKVIFYKPYRLVLFLTRRSKAFEGLNSPVTDSIHAPGGHEAVTASTAQPRWRAQVPLPS